MARKLIPLPKFLIPKLRQISRWWVQRGVALDEAKVYLPDGKYKNGNPKTKVKYVCAECKRQKINKYYEINEVQVDHINPIVPVEGFTNWDDYILKLFCDSKDLQVLCIPHHEEKTKKENEERKKLRAKYKQSLLKITKISKKVNKSLTKRKK